MTFRCDFDGSIPRDIARRLQMLARVLGLRYEWIRYDRTQHGWHMEIGFQYLTKLSPTEIVLVQSVLGSDWKRELFNARRARDLSRHPALWRRAPRWNVLYHRHVRGVSL